jgi:hypothetical protein
MVNSQQRFQALRDAKAIWDAQRGSLPRYATSSKPIRSCTIVLPTADGACLRIRKAATPDPDVQEFYRHLNISPDIIKPQHRWAPQGSNQKLSHWKNLLAIAKYFASGRVLKTDATALPARRFE